jgi:undecaprenyl diphosphate synthase
MWMDNNLGLKTENSKHTLSTLISQIDPNRIPHHIAIIPDGNRRWAKQRLAEPEDGHSAGSDILIDIVKSAKDLGVSTLTFFAFSTENWNRSPDEVQYLMELLVRLLDDQKESMIENGVKLAVIGDLSRLPDHLTQAIKEAKQYTKDCRDITLVLAINYGGRDDIRRAFLKMHNDCNNGSLNLTDVTESTISKYLDTHEWQDPDLFIRTSGELRVSNYLLWQIAYSEIYVAPVLWPDFRPPHLAQAIIEYQRRESRWGK